MQKKFPRTLVLLGSFFALQLFDSTFSAYGMDNEERARFLIHRLRSPEREDIIYSHFKDHENLPEDQARNEAHWEPRKQTPYYSIGKCQACRNRLLED